MERDSISNATKSFNNKYCLSILKPAFEEKIGETVCFHFKDYKPLTFPSVYVRHIISGAESDNTRELYNSIEFIINHDGGDEVLTKLMDCFYNTSKLKRTKKSSSYVNIDLCDYTDNYNPVKYSCMRLTGDTFVENKEYPDYKITQQKIILNIYYK